MKTQTPTGLNNGAHECRSVSGDWNAFAPKVATKQLVLHACFLRNLRGPNKSMFSYVQQLKTFAKTEYGFERFCSGLRFRD